MMRRRDESIQQAMKVLAEQPNVQIAVYALKRPADNVWEYLLDPLKFESYEQLTDYCRRAGGVKDRVAYVDRSLPIDKLPSDVQLVTLRKLMLEQYQHVLNCRREALLRYERAVSEGDAKATITESATVGTFAYVLKDFINTFEEMGWLSKDNPIK